MVGNKAAAPVPAEMEEATLLDRIVEEQAKQKAAIASRYQPVMSTKDLIDREKQIQYLVDHIMIDGVDYGWMPGTKPLRAAPGEYQAKPSLFKAGAERVAAFFGYAPDYRIDEVIEAWTGEEYGEPLFYYRVKCSLLKDNFPVGQGIGSASSWESKYRYRKGERKCPECRESGSIIRDKYATSGGWVCLKSKGGCGTKFPDPCPEIEDQNIEKVPNPDVADVVNTIQKMAQKRAYVAATLSATGLSARFTQDLEDLPLPPPVASEPTTPEAKPSPAPSGRVKAADQVPAELAAIFGRIQKHSNVEQELGLLAEALAERIGGMEKADAEFNRLVAMQNVKHWSKLSVEQARIVARDLWTAIQAAPEPAKAAE
jgi:hypothetical protein